ncbi:MAG TPA: tripartite tricarboxylate transporter substrate binding protein [Afifellaceae bacterium]|nr:tripartite tricarboxylate transporter substrate binding protein [Afifellaceae bacterium]
MSERTLARLALALSGKTAKAVLSSIAGLVALSVAATPVLAQGRAPTGPVEITTGSGPGGTPDVIMRTVAKIMAEENIVDFPVVVQNRTGGSHSNAYNYVLGKPGDESILLTLASPVFATPIMQGTPSVVQQVVPIAGFIQSELVFLVQPDSPYQTLNDFMEAAKQEPGKLRIAGAASGGTDHLATAQLEKAGGIKLTYVPYESGSAALATFLGRNVEGHFATLEEGLPIIESNRARPLAILSANRRPEPGYKDVPTARELGYDVVFGQFWGIAGPPGLDPEVAVWWEDKFRKVVASETWQNGLKEKFQRSDFYGLEEAGEYFLKEEATFRALMTDVGLVKQ